MIAIRKLPAVLQHVIAAVALTAFAALPALAQEAGPSPFDFYYNVYPEWKVQTFGTPSAAGTNVGNMGTLRNDRTVLVSNANPKTDTEDHEWSNSYIGFRGTFAQGPLSFGYDVQGLTDFQGSFQKNFRTRDAFVFVEHRNIGRFMLGQMDTVYKDWGDPVRMLRVSSSNIVSTSRIVSGVGWRAAGEASFNNRTNRMLTWVSPRWSGFNLGVSHAARPVETATRLKSTLTAVGVQWREGPWYAALVTEHHRDWLPMSFGPDAPAPAATSIRNPAATATSRDQAWRLSGAWIKGPWRVGSDISRMHYSESDTAAGGGAAGKFRSYRNVAAQVSAEYKLTARLRLAANHARASAGHCSLSGGVACSTRGLGGNHTSLGAMYSVNDFLNAFVLATHTRNNPGAQYGSSAQGANTNAYAIGIQLSER
ncbi:MAG: porin [Pseudomonadota bacterium]